MYSSFAFFVKTFVIFAVKFFYRRPAGRQGTKDGAKFSKFINKPG